MGRWVDRLDSWMDGWMVGRVEGRTDGRTDGWMGKDRWAGRQRDRRTESYDTV